MCTITDRAFSGDTNLALVTQKGFLVMLLFKHGSVSQSVGSPQTDVCHAVNRSLSLAFINTSKAFKVKLCCL